MVRGQLSLEMLLLLSASAALTAIALAGASSSLAAQKEAQAGALGALAASADSLWNSSTPPAFPANGTAEARVRLELATANPYYINERSNIRVIVWNLGSAAANLSRLTLEAEDENMSFAPAEQSDILVGFSKTLPFYFEPKTAGTFRVNARAYDANGVLVANSSTDVVVLPSDYGSERKALGYTILLERSGEKLAYSAEQGPSQLLRASVAYDNVGDRGYCSCRYGAKYVREYWYYSQSGPHHMCICIFENDVGKVWRLNGTPSFNFTLEINATNASGATVKGLLNASTLYTPLDSAGNATLAGMPSGFGTNPSYDSVLSNASGTTRLHSLSAYTDYATQLSYFDSVMSSGMLDCTSDMACQNIVNEVDKLNGKLDAFIKSNSSSASVCSVSPAGAECPASVSQYPTLRIVLNSSFLGGSIPSTSPDRMMVSGVEAEISTD